MSRSVPGVLHLTLAGELHDFASAGFDDHFKRLLPVAAADRRDLPLAVQVDWQWVGTLTTAS